MNASAILRWSAVVCLCLLHGLAIWVAVGGADGLTNAWIPWRDDHPLYFHSALVTRAYLADHGTTAGYDPAFMSGYAKSVVFPASSTLPELIVAFFGGSRPECAYKVYVLISAALVPWLIALAAVFARAGPRGTFLGVLLFLLYIWTDFPINYAAFGMLPYLLAIPLGLAATLAFARYLDEGGLTWWFAAAGLMALAVLVHLTAAMIIGPAAALLTLMFLARRKATGAPWSRLAGVAAIPLVVLALNAFWWMPGLWLAATKGPSDFAFAHPEGVWTRLVQILTTEPRVEPLLWLTGLPALAVLGGNRNWVRLAPIAGFAAGGFFWGYLAGGIRSLDFLQPGRHTFAFYSALALAAGIVTSDLLTRLGRVPRARLDVLGLAALLGAGAWYFGPMVDASARARLAGAYPFLTSRPSPRLLWVENRLKLRVKPGERLLYEEGGFGLPGVPDPFQGGRFSGLLANRLGIELIGGPYLHAALTTNFTQFGEGKLFGRADWGRDRFVRYAGLYRPAAILCWSPRARAFCKANPDLIRVTDDDGSLMVGRVIGFEGDTIVGKAEVEAGPGVLRVGNMEGGVDGSVVLRYHSFPCLRAEPPVAWDSVFLEDDPVPFIRLTRPTPGQQVTFTLRVPPGSRGAPTR